MVCRPVQFLGCLGALTRGSLLAAVVLIAAGGCARSAQPVASPQPFRDEHDPGDGFQVSEGAVPAEGEDSDSSDATTETTIEIEVDEDSAESSDDASADDSSTDESGSGEDGATEDGDDAFGSHVAPR